jgi:hypothetical protein
MYWYIRRFVKLRVKPGLRSPTNIKVVLRAPKNHPLTTYA